MKQHIWPLMLAATLTTSCNKEQNTPTPSHPKVAQQASSVWKPSNTQNQYISGGLYTININLANAMIESYLESIEDQTIPQIKSFVVDATTLRELLANTAIQKVKIHLAHTDSLVQTTDVNTYQSMNANAITLILTGVDVSGNYVLYEDSLAINKTETCPPRCSFIGTAGNDLISLF